MINSNDNLIISNEMIKKLNISIKLILEIIENNIKNKSKFLLPTKSSIKLDDEGFYNTMPCICEKYYTCKIVIRNIKNKPSLSGNIVLYDINTSKLLSTLDCKWITSIRTGAVALIATKYLAKSDFKDIALIGLGETIKAYMQCFLIQYPDRKVNFHLFRYKDHCEKFIKEYNQKNITWSIHENIEDLFSQADIIVSGVTYKTDLFTENTDIYKKGVLIIPIQTRGFQNCDTIFDNVVVDDDEHVKSFKNYGKFKKYQELTDIINKKNKGRISNDDRILSYNIGLGIHDNKLASLVYNSIIE
jgi:ornithine cyclodeaminase/alanine dehydrogenase-like protein (mu-crystallin family)